MKLWDKGYELHPEIEAYTAGDDVELDRVLVPYDCIASAVHARVLEQAGVLTRDETARLVEALVELKAEAERGEFAIRPDEEDGHTALENRLVARLGDLGKKIHTARSRNDQVVTALRLYMKDRLDDVGSGIDALVTALESRIGKDGEIELPGYTHTRRAMPSSVALWAGSFVESLVDAKRTVAAARELIDQSPLGTGAGYGIPVLAIDRELAARRAGLRPGPVEPALRPEQPAQVRGDRGLRAGGRDGRSEQAGLGPDPVHRGGVRLLLVTPGAVHRQLDHAAQAQPRRPGDAARALPRGAGPRVPHPLHRGQPDLGLSPGLPVHQATADAELRGHRRLARRADRSSSAG